MTVYIVYKQTDCKKTEIGRSTDQKTAIKILQEACDNGAGGCLYVMTQINEGEKDDGCAV